MYGFTVVSLCAGSLLTKYTIKRSQLTTQKQGRLITRTILVALLSCHLIEHVFSSAFWLDIFEDQIRIKKCSSHHVFASNPINNNKTNHWPRALATVLHLFKRGLTSAKIKRKICVLHVLSSSQQSGVDLAPNQQANVSSNLTVTFIGVRRFVVVSMHANGLVQDTHGFAIDVIRRPTSTNIDNEHQFVKQESNSHFLANEEGCDNRAIIFTDTRDGVLIMLVGTYNFCTLSMCAGSFNLSSQRTGYTDLPNQCTDVTVTSALVTSNIYCICGCARLCTCHRACERGRLHHLHHARVSVPLQPGTEDGSVPVYPGVPSIYPTSLPISTPDKTSPHYQRHFVGVPMCYIYMKEHSFLR